MTHPLIRILMLACLCGAGSLNAATIIRDGNGIMTGATGVDVAGASYDVEFVEGSCNSLNNNCTDFAFTIGNVSDAAQALVDEVLYSTDGSIPVGRLGLPASVFFTAAQSAESAVTGVVVYAISQLGIPSLSGLVEFGELPTDYDTSADPAIVYVEWTLSPVPLPAAAWLFMSAIAGLAGAKQLSRSRRPVEQI